MRPKRKGPRRFIKVTKFFAAGFIHTLKYYSKNLLGQLPGQLGNGGKKDFLDLRNKKGENFFYLFFLGQLPGQLERPIF